MTERSQNSLIDKIYLQIKLPTKADVKPSKSSNFIMKKFEQRRIKVTTLIKLYPSK